MKKLTLLWNGQGLSQKSEKLCINKKISFVGLPPKKKKYKKVCQNLRNWETCESVLKFGNYEKVCKSWENIRKYAKLTSVTSISIAISS